MARPTGTYLRQEVRDAVDFLKEVSYILVPVKKDAFFNLFAGFVNGAATDAQHAVAGAEQLLDGHPRLIALFYALVDPGHQATRFLERVKSSLSPQDYDQFLAKLHHVDEERSLDAHQVYELFKPLFADKHDDLLRGLADFLPTNYGPPPPPARGGADAPKSCSRPRRAKKPRVVDGDGLTLDPVCYIAADAGAAGSSRPRRAKKPRIDADDEPTLKPACYAADDVGAAGRAEPRSPASTPTSRRPSPPVTLLMTRAQPGAAGRDEPKKPLVDSDAPTPNPAGYVAAAPGPNDRAREPDDEVERFREAWEFETRYLVVVETLRRAKRLRRYKSLGSVEDLFPRCESRELLAELYDHRWEEVQEWLTKDDGMYTDGTLEAIEERLEVEEAPLVDEARRRRDPDRAAQRLHDLVRDIVREERVRVREEERSGSGGDRREPSARGKVVREAKERRRRSP